MPALSGKRPQSEGMFAPMALRSMLLLSGAAHPTDATLARLSDDELALLRATLMALNADDQTNAA
jgi:hypothetical protein